MTPAVKQLEKLAIYYQLHQYHHDKTNHNYGLEAAEKLNIAAEKIFKTLVIETEAHQFAVAIVPVAQQLNLKATAKALNAKKAIMAAPKKVQTTTGYVLGGVSPFGQKKKLPTIIDSNALKHSEIYVSGGKRGLEIAIAPSDLLSVLNAIHADIAD
ncbi:Cys-tRNA(Pro)/Cys-tRNA(Cys) deacylase [Thalassotalea insulae]|uniref:Cys-tRNA(Pro)/Cys-tRNA(Cys) deacylase n=1 Tax=Thalassotalea insulae TaxID=2056778 RepID=A0ABQ6GW99_9GAMM|nr:Cys-tRNA(Pro) deacylase [Thalassotalea insulae]GLX80175.1 Cys-tRNA(Pro)/Cys-tRNA(Cys) deacylase [Thalassotalea insulae]